MNLSKMKIKLSRIIINIIISKATLILIIICSCIITSLFSIERYQILFIETILTNVILWIIRFRNRKQPFYFGKIKFKL